MRSTSQGTFGDFLRRLAGDWSSEIRHAEPLFATIASNDARQDGRGGRTWGILHNIRDWDLLLIHARPFDARQVDVEIELPAGELLRFRLSLGRGRRRGDLYETPAELIRELRSSPTPRPPSPPP